jgi:hypothetical protein
MIRVVLRWIWILTTGGIIYIRRNRNPRRKSSSSIIFSTTNFTRSGPRSNRGPHGDRPTTALITVKPDWRLSHIKFHFVISQIKQCDFIRKSNRSTLCMEIIPVYGRHHRKTPKQGLWRGCQHFKVKFGCPHLPLGFTWLNPAPVLHFSNTFLWWLFFSALKFLQAIFTNYAV